MAVGAKKGWAPSFINWPSVQATVAVACKDPIPLLVGCASTRFENVVREQSAQAHCSWHPRPAGLDRTDNRATGKIQVANAIQIL